MIAGGETILRKKASVNSNKCVACGVCSSKCPKDAVYVYNGISALVDIDMCVGCSLCAKHCPANAISMMEVKIEE